MIGGIFPAAGTSGMTRTHAEFKCKKCRDRGHVPTKTGVVRCECLRSEITRSALLSAGLPLAIASADPAEISKSLPEALRLFLAEITSGDLWIIAPRISHLRHRMVAFAVLSAAGRFGYGTGLSLSRAIESRFDRDERAAVDHAVAQPAPMVFTIDDVGDHKKICSVIEEVVSHRRSCLAPTIYVSDLDVTKHTGRYGHGVCGFLSGFRKKLRVKDGPTACYRPFSA